MIIISAPARRDHLKQDAEAAGRDRLQLLLSGPGPLALCRVQVIKMMIMMTC